MLSMTGLLHIFHTICATTTHVSLICNALPCLSLLLASYPPEAGGLLKFLTFTKAHGSRLTWNIRDIGLGWDEPEQALLEGQRGMQPGDQSVHSRQRAGGLSDGGARLPFQLLLQAGQAG